MHIDNSILFEAVAELKKQRIIKRDADIAGALGYGASIVSEYLNNKKAVSQIFMMKLYEVFPQVKPREKTSLKSEDSGSKESTYKELIDTKNQLIKALEREIKRLADINDIQQTLIEKQDLELSELRSKRK